jgi:carbohydrate-selective porin OprB
MSLTPSLQYVADPSGDPAAKDAVVFGLRAQLVF